MLNKYIDLTGLETFVDKYLTDTVEATDRKHAVSSQGVIDYVETISNTLEETIATQLLQYLPLTGGTLTGAVIAPSFQTGTNESNYFQTKKMRGEGNASTYYHAVDWGYQYHDQVDFYEYGGIWNFHKCTSGSKDSVTTVGIINSKGWNGGAVLSGTPTAPTASAGTSTTQIATTAFVTNAINTLSTSTTSALDNKVDKEVGKALSSNDFTNDYKSQVENNTLNNHVHANKSILDSISDYIKSASVVDNVLTLTDNSDNDITFTDKSVTSSSTHYTPTTSGYLNVSADSTDDATFGTTSLVTGVKVGKDSAGHITSLSLESRRLPEAEDTWRDIKVEDTSIAKNTLNLKAGNNVTLSNSDGEVTINSSYVDTTYDVVTSDTNGLMSSTDKAKLDSITTYIKSASVSGETLTLQSSDNNSYSFTNTDSKVTSVNNHYTPTKSGTYTSNASSTTSATWDSTSLVTGVTLDKDSAGHITGVSVNSIKLPANPNINTWRPIKSGTVTLNDSNKTLTVSSSGSASVSLDSTTGTLTIGATDTNTDTKVTSVGNHYTPTKSGTYTADASSTVPAYWDTTSLVTGVSLDKDSAGHITGLSVSSIKMPANPNTWRDIKVSNTSISDNTLNLIAGSNVSLTNTDGEVTINSNCVNTEYSFSTGTNNGTFIVTPSNGSAQSVSIKGLKSLAYKDSLSASDVNALPDTTTYIKSISKTGDVLTITPSSGESITFEGATYDIVTTSTDGLMSSTDKAKLDGVATGAQVNIIESIKVNGIAQTVTSKAVDISVPTRVSQLSDSDDYAKKATTLSGYGITDAKISNGVITLGTSTITPLTSHQDISGKADKATTLSGYGITDAKIVNGTITLGSNSITPLTSHQDISGKADKATTLSGYGITDAKIVNGTITLGSNSITPLTSHQDISGKADKATTLSGYGITDAKIVDGTITLGTNSITPITDVSGKANKATTLSGYGITDAKIANGTITLGSNSITPLTSHQDISGKADKATTLSGYGITDAKIVDGTITLGTKTITPLTTHQDISGKADKATTLSGYGITDAKIANGVITLGNNSITPITSHQNISGKADKATTLSGYGITNAYTKDEIDTKLASSMKYKGQKDTYADLPATGNNTGDVWDVAENGHNYAWNGTSWDDLGGTVDLSDYYTKSDTNTLLNNKANKATTLSGYGITDAKISSGTITLGSSSITPITSHQDISGKADKSTTLSGYGITDAKIANGTITLGSNSITPITSHQDISGKADKATTLSGYGITDAKISNGTITLGTSSITPITDVSGKADKSTTLSGYGITDAKISNGTITLGSNSITPITSHQDISGKANKATTLSGYGITDAKIANGVITLGSNSITPITDISGKADKATTLSGYGITDAKIANGTITLGSSTITPITSHQDISGKANKATTLSGYGITDAKIANGVITLGTSTITPITSHQDISGKADKATTLSGYGITDAKIVSGVITLGGNSITPLTSVPTASSTTLGGIKVGSNLSIASGVLSVPVTNNDASLSYGGTSTIATVGSTDITLTMPAQYSHPTYTSKTSGLYKITVDGTGHVSATTAVAKSDITALGIPASDTNTWRAISVNGTSKIASTASTTLDFVSGNNITLSYDSGKLTITGTNTVYTHPTYTAYSSGLYKVTTNSLGHVTSATAVTKSDITNLGIPASNTTYSVANYDTLGLIKPIKSYSAGTISSNTSVSDNTTTTITVNNISNTAGRYYCIEVDKNGVPFVNVPWVDTNTVYTHPTYTAKSSGLYKIQVDGTGHVYSATAVTKADITNLGIPSSDTNTWRAISINGTSKISNTESTTLNLVSGNNITLSYASGNLTITGTNTTYPVFSTSANGLVPKPSSSSTSLFLNSSGTWTTPIASASVLGFVKPIKSYSAGTISSNTSVSDNATTTITVNTISNTAGRYYCIEVDKNGVPFVNVPWVDTNTNTWRAISVAGTTKIASSASTVLNFVNGTNTTVTYDGGIKVSVSGTLADSNIPSLAISKITNLQTTLDGKANSSHTHSYAGSSSAGGDATASLKVKDSSGTMALYAEVSNEINFGGTNASGTIYFGYRAKDSKPIPTSYIFGNGTTYGSITANRVTAKGRITVPTSGGSWVSGMTLTNASIGIETQNSSSSYHPIVAVKTYSGNVVNMGSYVDKFGFYGYLNDRTANGTDWSAVFDSATGLFTCSGGFSGSLSGNATSATTATTATTATKLSTSPAGSATQPVYFSGGVPVACSYTLGKSVPSNAVFTDTTYSVFSTSANGLVPKPSSLSTTLFLNSNGTWTTPTNTDTKVTSASNHYTPSADSSSVLSATASGTSYASFETDSVTATSVITGFSINRDSKGHVTGISATSVKLPKQNSISTLGNITTATSFTNTTASTSTTTGAVKISGGLGVKGNIYGAKVYNAVWNDLADCIPVNEDVELEPGCCYCFNGKKYYKSNKYLADGIIGIHSDTYGMNMGHKPEGKQMDVAVSGFVLAYVDKEYKVGTPLTCTKNGKLTKIRLLDRILFPHKIVATYWKNELSEEWGSEKVKVKVNGRKWVKIK